MERFIIFTLNTASNEVVVKQSFKVLADADAYFVKDTTFNTISDWVESYGHYSCNSNNFNYYERPELIILLDIQYEFPENETNTYVAIEFHKFRNALINRTEEPTVYLDSNSTLTSENKEQFSNLGNILYYPGAFTDFGPMKFFFENSSIDTVIYTDYMITREILEESIQNFINDFDNRDSIIITPNVFNKNNWNEFWPEQTNEGINNAFGIEYNFLVNNVKKCRFIYLVTEAIKTYSILLECNLVPDVIVLQDHSSGGNWTRFGGDSPLYRMSINNLPNYIFIEPKGNTEPWKPFTQITDSFEIPGAMHNNRRALYKQKLFVPRNLSGENSRWFEWNKNQPIVDGVRINQYSHDELKIGYWEELIGSKFEIGNYNEIGEKIGKWTYSESCIHIKNTKIFEFDIFAHEIKNNSDYFLLMQPTNGMYATLYQDVPKTNMIIFSDKPEDFKSTICKWLENANKESKNNLVTDGLNNKEYAKDIIFDWCRKNENCFESITFTEAY